MKFTVFGGRGFIGRHLVERLKRSGFEVYAPPREALGSVTGDLGHVIYAIGLTGDFRRRPIETVEAHVGVLAEQLQAAQLQKTRFQSWLYLSSTRIYGGIGNGELAAESAPLRVSPCADAIYDLSKLLGEALCLGQAAETVRIARLSNVYGAGQGTDSFLGSVVDEFNRTGHVVIREAASSSKDYVSLDDACALMEAIALTGRSRIYNIASGGGVTHRQIADSLMALRGGSITFAADGMERIFPSIDVSRVKNEFGFEPRRVTDDMVSMLTDL